MFSCLRYFGRPLCYNQKCNICQALSTLRPLRKRSFSGLLSHQGLSRNQLYGLRRMVLRDQGRKCSRTVVRRGFLTKKPENRTGRAYGLIRGRSLVSAGESTISGIRKKSGCRATFFHIQRFKCGAVTCCDYQEKIGLSASANASFSACASSREAPSVV